MAEAKATKDNLQTGADVPADLRPGLSALKYFIHDSTEAFRFQLTGSLTEIDVKELSGCWQTAKSTVGARTLVLDLRELRNCDEAGREWLLAMAREGATYLPESYFRTNLSGQSSGANGSAKKSGRLFGRMISGLRGPREIPAESSTQAQ